jgi:hypothetical protein
MKFREVRPGLYMRIDTPRRVKITPKFVEAIRRDGNSALLQEIVEQAARDSERLAERQTS